MGDHSEVTKIEHAQRVHRVMNFVRSHLKLDLTLTTLAPVAGYSDYHFHRVFKAVTGETLSGFVQRARLERAAYLMKTSPERRLDSIALEVGFGAHSDFTRVFKKHYGVAPSGWDRASRLDSQPIVDDFEEIVARAKAESPPPIVRVVERPAVDLIYVRTKTPFLGAPLRDGYERLIHGCETLGLDWRKQELLGWSWDNYKTTPIDLVHYDLGFALPDGFRDGGLEELGRQHFDAHRAVQVRCRGPLLDIAVAWEVLYTDWLPSSGHEPLDLPGMKVFERRPDELGWEIYDLWCTLAIEPLGA